MGRQRKTHPEIFAYDERRRMRKREGYLDRRGGRRNQKNGPKRKTTVWRVGGMMEKRMKKIRGRNVI